MRALPLLCRFVALVVLPALPARAADWPIFRGDRGLTGIAAGSLPDELEVLWTFEVEGAIVSSPVVVGGYVYFGADDFALHCVDAATGVERWKFATEDMIEAPPLVIDGSVYIGSSDFRFYAVDAATGKERWRAATDDKILGGANWERSEGQLRILVGSYDTHLYCFDAESGQQLWRYATDNYVNGTPAIHDGLTVFGGCDAILHVVSTITGERVAALELGPECHVAGSVALADGRAYFGHYGNQFVCVDLQAERVRWTYDSQTHAFFSSPAIGTDRIVFGGRDRHLHCARKDDGQKLWTFPTRRKVDGSPVLVGDKVVFGSGDGRLYVLALADGAELWSYDLGKSIVASPAVVDGRIYVGSTDKRLYAFGPPDASGKPESENQ